MAEQEPHPLNCLQQLSTILDSLRNSITEMHLPRFRSDVGATLACRLQEDALSALVELIRREPFVRSVNLTEERCDRGEVGYELITFRPLRPHGNGEYGDAVRDCRGAQARLALTSWQPDWLPSP